MSEYKSITNGKLTIILIDDNIKEVKERAERFAKWIDDPTVEGKGTCNGHNCTGADYISASNRLLDIAERIINEYPAMNIFECIPLTKSQDFPKGENILLADTGIRYVTNGDYYSKETLQLRLTHIYDFELKRLGIPFEYYDDIENIRVLTIQEFASNSKTPPVFDENNNPRKVTKVRNTYLKDNEIIPGTVYTDNKGVEYLYLGKIVSEDVIVDANYDIEADPDKIRETLEGTSSNAKWNLCKYRYSSSFVYVKPSAKIKKLAEKCGTLTELVDEIIINASKDGKLWDGSIGKSDAKRFVNKVETLVENEVIKPHCVVSKPFNLPSYIEDSSIHRYFNLNASTREDINKIQEEIRSYDSMEDLFRNAGLPQSHVADSKESMQSVFRNNGNTRTDFNCKRLMRIRSVTK